MRFDIEHGAVDEMNASDTECSLGGALWLSSSIARTHPPSAPGPTAE